MTVEFLWSSSRILIRILVGNFSGKCFSWFLSIPIRIMLDTVWPEPIWIKVSGWWQIPPQHQSTHLRGPESATIETLFQNQSYLVKIPLNLNIVKQDLPHKIFWKFDEVRSERGGFQLMLILVLLGMYFDAVVVFITSQTLLFRLALAMLCQTGFFTLLLFFKLWHFFLENHKLHNRTKYDLAVDLESVVQLARSKRPNKKPSRTFDILI